MDMIAYGLSFLGTPYMYGGNSPMMGGLDCSGLVCEMLKSQGHIRYNQDMSSQMIYEHLTRQTHGAGARPARNSLLFFGRDIDHINHIAVAIDEHTMLEAGGGDSTTITLKEASRRGAMVRVRPIGYRKDFLVAVDL